MHLDDGRVQLDGFDLEAHDLLPLQALEDALQHAALGPAVHARIDGVPVAETLGQSAPLAALLSHVQQCVEHLQVGETNIAPLPRQAGFDTTVLCLGDFHIPKHTTIFYLVLTRPKSSSKTHK